MEIDQNIEIPDFEAENTIEAELGDAEDEPMVKKLK